jgi:hypothetical protein
MAKKKPIIHEFSEEFKAELKAKASDSFDNNIKGYYLLSKKCLVCTFDLWLKKPPIREMEVTLSKPSLEELEQAVIRFLS